LTCFLATTVHLLFGLPAERCNVLLSWTKAIIGAAFAFSLRQKGGPNTYTQDQLSLLDAFPTNVDGIISRLRLRPVTTAYACCKKCFALHEPISRDAGGRPIYGSICSYQEYQGLNGFDGSKKCRMKLTKPQVIGGETVSVPLREYLHQSLKDWMGRLLSRQGIEVHLDAAWTRMSKLPKETMFDIWDGPEIRNFLGSDGTPFSNCPNGEGHYVFSLFVDWFNPFRNRKGGKNVSVGAIYMVCLNLPPHIRYKVENVYLAGIIPGPREPSTSQMNHFLHPLVDELLEFWDTGVYYQSTNLCPEGRLVRCAVLPLICDLPALRKTAGFSGHSSNMFCSFCLTEKPKLNSDLDKLKFKYRTSSKHRELATLWRESNISDREALTRKYGIRWSELLRLTYWKPIEFSTLDAMHNLFLGLLQHHCRRLWRMPNAEVGDDEDDEAEKLNDAELRSQDDPYSTLSPQRNKGKMVKEYTPDQEMEIVQKLVYSANRKKNLNNFRGDFLAVVVKFNNLPVAPTGKRGKVIKSDLISALHVRNFVYLIAFYLICLQSLHLISNSLLDPNLWHYGRVREMWTTSFLLV
jgi:hypothetical protein